ncbi:MAG: very short patch repair endonuclease [Endomicrobium sp.]|jgi:DNA mismatch endonuclease (patch repair protein)|nr:very short patch repair endonuclease [Endomicrobium sp.]
MTDVFNKKKRSSIMKLVKSSNNVSTELKLINVFKKFKITGWRRKYKIKGKPDFVFLKNKIAVFTDGCFWHGHNCRNTKPKANKKYWFDKISRNKKRDKDTAKYLSMLGWKVFRIWECGLKNKNIAKTLKRFERFFKSAGKTKP